MEFDDRALVLGDTLVLADLHVGREAARVELPLGERADLRSRLAGLLDRHEPATVVFAGDILDTYGDQPQAATETLDALVGTVRNGDAMPVAVRGNHDAMLAGVWSGEIHDAYRLDGTATVVCHGHEAPTASADRYVVGHDHPTIRIEGRRRPCYLVGEQPLDGGAGEVVMLPAFNRLIAGVRTGHRRAGGFQSPLVTDPDALAPVVWDRDGAEAVRFPRLEDFRHLL